MKAILLAGSSALGILGLAAPAMAADAVVATPIVVAQATPTPTPTPTPAPAATEESEESTAASGSEEVTVTGSRLRKNEFTSDSPIEVITREETVLEGLVSAASIVQQTSATGGGIQVNNLVTGFVFNGGGGINTISLRGLGEQRTLVILDGRRLGPAGTRGTVGPIDLNVIPSSLIQRVEILKDGASSIYGSDAVAGVVNFITRTDFDGLEVDGYRSFSEEGGGEQTRASVAWGTTGDNGLYFNIGGEYYKQEVLRNSDRDYTSCAVDLLRNPTTGALLDYINTDPGQLGGLGGDLEGRKCWNQLSRVLRTNLGDMIYPDAGVTYPTAAQGNNAPVATGLVRQARGNFPLTMPYAHYDNAAFQRGSAISPAEIYSVAANFGYDINDSVSIYGQLLWNQRDSIQYGYRQLFPSVNVNNPGNSFPGSFTSLLPIIPLKSDRSQSVEYYRGVLGLQGEFETGFGDWDWDIYYQGSYSDATYDTDIIYNDRILATTGATACNPNPAGGNLSGFNCADLAAPIPWTSARILNGEFNANEQAFLFGVDHGTTTYEQQLVEASLAGDLWELPAGPLAFAIGAQYRYEALDDTPGEQEIQYNLWGSTSAGHTAGQDHIWEAFAEIGVPILKDVMFAKSLELSASGRYVDYESYGSGQTYKIGLNWQIDDRFRIRASHGTSFRAPALYELYLADQTSFLGQTAIDPCINWGDSSNPNIQANCAAEGIPDDYNAAGSSSAEISTGGGAGFLSAETATNNTIGLIWTERSIGFSLAVDYFDIKVRDEIGTFSAANILAQCYGSDDYPTNPFCAQFTRDTTSPAGLGLHQVDTVQAGYVNLDSQRNRGIDVTGRWTHDFDFGTITADASFTWMLEDTVQVFATGTEENYLGSTYGYRGPAVIGNGSLRWEKDDWTVAYNLNYIGFGSDDGNYGGDTFNSTRYAQLVQYLQRTQVTIYHDISVRKTWDDGKYSAIIGVNNVFDEEPPFQSAGQFRRGTASLNAYDLVGRRVFLNLSFKM